MGFCWYILFWVKGGGVLSVGEVVCLLDDRSVMFFI